LDVVPDKKGLSKLRSNGDPSPGGSGRALDAGFTLVELIVCLVLVAGLTALVVPRLAADRPDTLERWAAAVSDDLARLHRDAIGSGAVRIASSEALVAKLAPNIHLALAEPPEIVFLPNGMTNGAIWRLESEQHAVELSVDWLTGRVNIDAR
jgi:prepilin-type N-terminal cleavage/methylation domain-containing protein